MKNIITFSAPAKVILSGEHSVVYGRPALVCTINRRLNFSVSKEKLLDKKKADKNEEKIVKLIEKNVVSYLKKNKIPHLEKKYFFKIDSNIPLGCGLGSSAALSVAATAGFLKLFTGKNFSKETINQLAYQIETYFHQNPSGVDNTASCFGGLIYYRKEFEFLKNISFLNFKIPKEFSLFLIDSGKPEEDTKTMVKMVTEKYKKNLSLMESILFDMEKTTKKMVLAIKEGNKNLFQEAILDNEIFLEMLGVVSSKTKKLLQRLSAFGVGKITGAGGKKRDSGFILFFAEKEKNLIDFLQKEKISFFKLEIDSQGLYEKSKN
jgi:mevalonate kinase